MGVDDHAEALETDVAMDTVDTWPALGVVDHHVLRFDGYQKTPLALVEEGEIIEIALECQFRLAGATGKQ